jgi:hypothetical protein
MRRFIVTLWLLSVAAVAAAQNPKTVFDVASILQAINALP